MAKLNAKVIMAKCSKMRKAFGIRIEQRGDDWVRTWAFPMDEREAKREGYDANTVSGSMNAAEGYPGCPHCGAVGFAQCPCGKIGCDGGLTASGDCLKQTCPWCGETSQYRTADSFNVSGGGY
ncbi:MAG: hypothetical protein LBD18_03250 [Treponema sp.]|jgi:hypothetical protein|nr:hypothetical protein [Treponema sp.]